MLLRYDRFELDISAGVFRVDGRVVSVQPKVYCLLRLLMERQGDVITKNELFAVVWPDEFVTDSALTWCVSQARKALGQSRARRSPIETVHRRGYRFAAQVVTVSIPQGQGIAPAQAARPQDPFVGRHALMQSLEHALSAAEAGKGRVCLLRGEAGIGKTSTAHQLALRARQLGFDVWQGRGFAGDGASALWPWVQVLRDAMTQEELASEGKLVTKLLVDGDRAPRAAGSEPETFWILDRVTQLLVRTELAPRLLILEDLHDFDDASLRLLLLLAQHIASARLLVVATLRVPAVLSERQKHDCETLARLADQFDLDGLDAAAIKQYAQAKLGQALSERASDVLVRKTGGIPLFVRAALEALVRRDNADSDDLRIPSSTRDILVENLRELQPPCRELIEVASVLRDQLSSARLQPMCQLSPDEFLLALNDAVAAQVLLPREDIGSFSFRHGLLAEVIYEGLSPHRRAELHLRAAHVLDIGSSPEQCSEVAYHYHRALPLAEASCAMQWAQSAAEAAARLGAYDQAARCQSWAIEAFGLMRDRDPRLLAELLGRLGELQRASGQYLAAHKSASGLVELAKRHGLVDPLLRAVRTLRVSTALAWLQNPMALDALERARSLVAEGDRARQSQLLAYLSQIPPYAHDMQESKRLSTQSLALAREARQPNVLHDALRSRLYALSGPEDLRAQLVVADELLRLVEPHNPVGIVAQEAHLTRFLAFLQLGEMGRADDALAHMTRAARQSKVPEAIWHAERLLATRALARGESEAAEQAFRRLDETRERLDLAYEDVFLGPQITAILLERGQLEYLTPRVGKSWLERESREVLGVPRAFEIAWVVALAKRGQLTQARSSFEELAETELTRLPENTYYLSLMVEFSNAAVALRDLARAELILSRLERFADHNAVHVHGFSFGAVSHFLGRLSQLLGRKREARALFERAVERNQQTEQPAHAARSAYLLSGLLQRDQPRLAAKLLDHVERDARKLGLLPLLKQTERLRARGG